MKQTNNIVLQKLLKKTIASSSSKLENRIGFYKTILELERSKEPDIATYYSYELHFKDNDSNIILIDMPCNIKFTEKFEENRKVKFPQDLYVGIAVSLKDKPEPIVAFSVTVNYEDLNGFDPYEYLLPIKLSNLTLESRHISSIGLEDESKIDEIDRELSKIRNIDDLRELVKGYFGDSVELKQELQLGLSSKNIALSQIAAELNKFNSQMVERNDLLKHFLMRSEFDIQIE